MSGEGWPLAPIRGPASPGLLPVATWLVKQSQGARSDPHWAAPSRWLAPWGLAGPLGHPEGLCPVSAPPPGVLEAPSHRPCKRPLAPGPHGRPARAGRDGGEDLAVVSTPCLCQSAWNGGPGLPAAPGWPAVEPQCPWLWVLPGGPSLCPLRWRGSGQGGL